MEVEWVWALRWIGGGLLALEASMGKRAQVERARQDVGESLARTHLFEEAEDNRVLRIAVAVAILLHVGLFLVHLPKMTRVPSAEPRQQKVYVVQPLRFKQPPPRAAQRLPERKVKRIPMPDPTPDDPEPIRIEEPEQFDLPPIDDLVIGIPEAPPEPGSGSAPLAVGGDVIAPEKIYAPTPMYTEEARKARIQGVVVVQTIIDDQGHVTDVDVLKPLTLGLTESAVETVKQWTFKPATLNGKPVSVYFVFTVRFHLQ